MPRYKRYKNELECLMDPKHPKSSTEMAGYYEILRLQHAVDVLTIKNKYLTNLTSGGRPHHKD